MASTFYASADGTVFHPVSDEARRCAHDSSMARERLAQKLAQRKAAQETEEEQNNAGELETKSDSSSSSTVGAPVVENNVNDELALRQVENRLRAQQQSKAAVAQRKQDRRLAQDTRFFKGNTKAIPSNYVRKADVADNKHARAIVHHTGRSVARLIALFTVCCVCHSLGGYLMCYVVVVLQSLRDGGISTISTRTPCERSSVETL